MLTFNAQKRIHINFYIFKGQVYINVTVKLLRLQESELVDFTLNVLLKKLA